ncbi:MAG TPA: phosphatase PAP2 family protein [Candidatus Polarisedimenticolia bacterium]|nr:phosphatase PAP2 family protein [Candidatus Polarisedimenticolia bacterium]
MWTIAEPGRASLSLVDRFDISIVEAFNSLAGRSHAFDRLVVMLESNSLLKTGLIVGLLWFFWFSSRNQPENRRRIIRTLVAACIAIAVARVGQRLLPPRLRPIFDPSLSLTTAWDFDPSGHAEWSSFPSDHAVMLCALAAGLWTVSRRWGAVAFAWVLGFVFPVRLILGLHYPSDVLAGGLVGVVIVWLVSKERLVVPKIVDRAMRLEAHQAALFYAGIFLLTWQVADFFGDCRYMAHALGAIALGH